MHQRASQNDQGPNSKRPTAAAISTTGPAFGGERPQRLTHALCLAGAEAHGGQEDEQDGHYRNHATLPARRGSSR
ncbi:hypothetical protein [Streptomyces sp. NPDC005533]|uniref:hypothetical protein n=1 Tax=Streptomyces sp. NPDC005533 TaxID=3364723 RepID=UPI0036C18856